MNPARYKHVIDGDREWIKEKQCPGDANNHNAVRHAIQEGPRGGKFFYNNEREKVYVGQLNKVVRVYPEDHGTTVNMDGPAQFGN